MLALSPAIPLLLVGICLGAALVAFLLWVSLADRANGVVGSGTAEAAEDE
ncbi:MAG: hypothetical protein K1X95_06285 [Acidimicrobiia bacterium]|nr:hypothetical protein [Acidimicrobiia bacterium]